MPLRTKVFVSYGPYRNCLGSLTYEPARLDGLRTLLEANEHQMIYHQTKNLNELAITVNGEMVYQGKVDQLDFSKLYTCIKSRTTIYSLVLRELP